MYIIPPIIRRINNGIKIIRNNLELLAFTPSFCDTEGRVISAIFSFTIFSEIVNLAYFVSEAINIVSGVYTGKDSIFKSTDTPSKSLFPIVKPL